VLLSLNVNKHELNWIFVVLTLPLGLKEHTRHLIVNIRCSANLITRSRWIAITTVASATCSSWLLARGFSYSEDGGDKFLRNIILIILGEEYKLWSSSLCSFLQPPVTSSLFGLNILLNTLFSNTLSLCSSLNVRDQVSHPYRTVPREMSGYNSQRCFQAWQRHLDARRTMKRDLECVEVYSLRSSDSTLYIYFLCRISLLIFSDMPRK
jgi:hypothetical protein